MAALFRFLFLIPIGFILACFTAAAVVVFALLPDLPPGPWPFEIVGAVIGMTVVVGVVAALPTLAATLLAEAFGWRSLLYWLAVGGIIAAVVAATPYLAAEMEFVAALVALIAWVPEITEVGDAEPAGLTTIALAAGFVGAFVYWLVAGRLAGTSDVISRA